MANSLKKQCQPCSSSLVGTNIAEKPSKCRKNPNSFESSSNSNVREEAVIECREKLFKCSKCPYSCKTSKKLKSHNVTHSKEKPFKCPKCPYSCKRSTDLTKHKVVHSKEMPFKCPKCPYSGKRSSDLKYHMITHSKELPFKCPNCPFSSKLSSSLLSHKFIHSQDNPFKCSKCPYSCKKPTELRRHRIIHFDENPFRCTICLKDFTRPDKLQIHVKIHSRPSKLFKCCYCSFSSINIQGLKRHGVLHISQNPNEKQRALLCSFPPCEFKTLDKSKLAIHHKKHLREESFKCTHCGFYAINNHFLDHHIASCHTQKGGVQKKEYFCKLCVKKFGENELLAAHNEQVHGIPFVVLELLPL